MPLFYALTLFVSAFLLFLVQPLVGKMLLPLLGGTPIVWNTCMVFFQAMLLGGYLYSHATTTKLDVRKQVVVHTSLLLLTIGVLGLTAVVAGRPVAVAASLSPQGDRVPFFGLIVLLFLAIGLPFFTVATSAPLLQKWFTATGHPASKDPYFLYAASNLGSLLALFAYPILLEPNLKLATQTWVWAGGFVALAALTVGCGLMLRPGGPPLPRAGEKVFAPAKTEAEPLAWSRRLRWIALAFVPSSLMLGLTTYLVTDIASFPMLWLIPLGLYLLTFIIAFARLPDWFQTVIGLITPVVVLLLIFLMTADLGRRNVPYWTMLMIALHCLTFFLVALMCHGELARTRPGPARLTEFYLWMSVGGVLGGLFNALVAPLIFNDVYEYRIALVISCLLIPPLGQLKRGTWPTVLDVVYPVLLFALAAFLMWRREYAEFPVLNGLLEWFHTQLSAGCEKLGERFNLRWNNLRAVVSFGVPALLTFIFVERPLRFGLCVAAILLAAWVSEDRSNVVRKERSSFGVLKVQEDEDADLYRYHTLIHGTTIHGKQQIFPEDDPPTPLTYYHRRGPIGDIFAQFRGADRKTELAFIGLGTGSLTAYAESGQHVTIYEIDPLVKRLASDPEMFTYLTQCQADTRIVLGDARVQLERDRDKKYGLIVVDAFSSDSIPVHLLTKESMQLYLDRLEFDGVLAVHISNRYLRLGPVVARLAKEFGLVAQVRIDDGDERIGKSGSNWVALARRPADLKRLAREPGRWWLDDPGMVAAFGVAPLSVPPSVWEPLELPDDAPLWTDDFSNILGVMIWK